MATRRSLLRHTRSLGFISGVCLASMLSSLPVHSQALAAPAALSLPFTDRMNEYPSLWQEDPRAAFPGGGTKFCMPVAASNALMWLAEHGYLNLLPNPSALHANAADRDAQQIALIKAFTAPPYATMKEDHGASNGWIARGIQRYIKDRGYAIDQLEWRPAIAPSPSGGATSTQGSSHSFTLDEIKAALRTGATVWIAIARYKPVADVPDTYQRTTGHAMTLVGFGLDETGRPDSNVLIVHDPFNHKAISNWPNDRLHLGIMGGGHWAGTGVNLGKPGESMAGRYVFVSPKGTLPADGRFALLADATVLRLHTPVPPAVP